MASNDSNDSLLTGQVRWPQAGAAMHRFASEKCDSYREDTHYVFIRWFFALAL